MFLPRLASLVVAVLFGLATFGLAQFLPSDEVLRDVELSRRFSGAYYTLIMLSVGILATVSWCSFIGLFVSFAMEPDEKPGKFRFKPNIFGRAFAWISDNSFEGYCATTLWGGFMASVALLMAIEVGFLLYNSGPIYEKVSGYITEAPLRATILSTLVLSFVLGIYSMSTNMREKWTMGAFAVFFLSLCAWTAVDWENVLYRFDLTGGLMGILSSIGIAFLIIFFFGVCAAGIYLLRERLLKIQVYHSICPTRDPEEREQAHEADLKQ